MTKHSLVAPARSIRSTRYSLTARGRAAAPPRRRRAAPPPRLMDGLPREQVRAPRLMAAAYQPLLHRLEARGWEAPRRRLGKRKRDLLGAVLRYGIV